MKAKRAASAYPKVPAFATEREEAEWWDAHPQVAVRILSQARRDGTITRGELIRRTQEKPSVLISIRMRSEEVAKAKAIAGRKGLPYQTYMKTLIRQGMQRDERAS